jgi:hypothetical protein
VPAWNLLARRTEELEEGARDSPGNLFSLVTPSPYRASAPVEAAGPDLLAAGKLQGDSTFTGRSQGALCSLLNFVFQSQLLVPSPIPGCWYRGCLTQSWPPARSCCPGPRPPAWLSPWCCSCWPWGSSGWRGERSLPLTLRSVPRLAHN